MPLCSLLQHSVGAAQSVVDVQRPEMTAFADAQSAEMQVGRLESVGLPCAATLCVLPPSPHPRPQTAPSHPQDRIFDELNTLSVVYRAPASSFIDAEQGAGEGAPPLRRVCDVVAQPLPFCSSSHADQDAPCPHLLLACCRVGGA